MNNQKLATFGGEKYLNLESYRKSGQPVLTPVWFAEKDGTIYVYTLEDAYKVKRMRNNPRVRIAPCDFRGKLRGEWVEAKARAVTPEEESRAHKLLDAKYWGKRFGNLVNRFRKRERIMFAIEPV